MSTRSRIIFLSGQHRITGQSNRLHFLFGEYSSAKILLRAPCRYACQPCLPVCGVLSSRRPNLVELLNGSLPSVMYFRSVSNQRSCTNYDVHWLNVNARTLSAEPTCGWPTTVDSQTLLTVCFGVSDEPIFARSIANQFVALSLPFDLVCDVSHGIFRIFCIVLIRIACELEPCK